MIEFNFNTMGEEIIITLKTTLTQIGTFHKMVAVIYSLDWDILSGDIRSVEEKGEQYSYDILKLKKEGKKHPVELGLLMDTVFSSKSILDEVVKSLNIQKVEPRKFFKGRKELIFEDDHEKQATVFYIEADNGKGLLYYVTKVLMDYKIDIKAAKIETDPNTQTVMDTFYLTDEKGGLFGDLPVAEEIRERILKPLR
jgi:UTP:GlnB (protein PII) uridylyltransferase